MTQTKKMSLIESTTNVVVGYFLAVATQLIFFPLFGIKINLTSNLELGIIFLLVSLARSYILRRFFNGR